MLSFDYAAIIVEKYSSKEKDLWAYRATIISEARSCGGKGWLLYDAAFRQQMPSLEQANFDRLYTASCRVEIIILLRAGLNSHFLSRVRSLNDLWVKQNTTYVMFIALYHQQTIT